MNKRRTRPAFAYGSVIEALSFGLYPEKEHVIREFIQNAFDALDEWKRLGVNGSLSPIEIRVEPPSIVIADRGLGMDQKRVNQFRYLGYSEKQHGQTAGFRGIGKNSGFAVAEKIIVTTSKYGVPKKFQVAIDASEMLDEIKRTKNPPLDELLKKHSSLVSYPDEKDSHYTVVELHGIRSDANTLFDLQKLKRYICKNAPLPFDPSFKFGNKIARQLESNIPNYLAVDISFNGERLYKPFLENSTDPEFQEIFLTDQEDSSLTAYSWYCQNKGKGQFADRDSSGLIFRVRNFAVGDRHLTRKELWEKTPERAFYFFGEVHVLDSEVLPSSDRSNFEDNEARGRLYTRSKRIAQVLSRKAGEESEIRRFAEVTENAGQLVASKGDLIRRGAIPKELKTDIEFAVRKALDDVQTRLRRTRGKKKRDAREKSLMQEAEGVVKKAKRLISQIENGPRSFVDLEKALRFNEQTREVYRIIVDCLREHFRDDMAAFEGIVEKIHVALRQNLK